MRGRVLQLIADEIKGYAEMEADFHDPENVLSALATYVRMEGTE